MIIAKNILGRLGNQLFQYAYCRALQEAVGGGQLAFNFEKVYRQGDADGVATGFEDSLRHFQVKAYERYEGDPVRRYGSRRQQTAYRLYQRLGYRIGCPQAWRRLLGSTGLYTYSDQHHDFMPDIAPMKVRQAKRQKHGAGQPLVVCYDFLEVPSAFAHIREQLLDELTPKEAPLAKNQALYDVIAHSNSVCVSVRRGDYLNPKYAAKFFVCDENYLRQAIEQVKTLVKDPVLIFFSDDIEWVKNNVKTDLPSYYETGDDPVWEKLRLMYSCKHFIISNSTFSWWSQYLSRNVDKVVIAPDHWFNDKTLDCRHLLSESFTTIPCPYRDPADHNEHA